MSYIYPQDEFQDSLCIFLSSDQCLEFYPNNSQHSFIVNLFKPINCLLTPYEVAVTDVYLNKSPLRNLFDLEPGKVFVNVNNPDNTQVTVSRNPSYSLSKWLSHCSLSFRNANFPNLNFAFVLNPSGLVAAISFENAEDKYEYVRFPKALSQALGYTYSDFVLGTHVTEVPPSLELFQRLSENIVFELLKDPIKTTVTLTKSKRGDGLYESPLDLVTIFNSKMEDQGIKISMTSGMDETEIEIDQDNTTLSFNKPLSKILGIPDSTVISNKGTTTYDHMPNLNIGNEFFLFLSDLISPQHVSSQMIPLLRMTEQPEHNGKLVHVKMNPLMYLPVKREIINSIQFEIKNELMRNVRFSTGSVVKVVLHMRKYVS